MKLNYLISHTGLCFSMKLARKAICALVFASITLLFGCYKEIQSEKNIYSDDFETSTLNNIDGGILNIYNGTKVLGFYNNSGFKLKKQGLESHELIRVSFDLYLHDTWAGNNTGTRDVIDGPDIWELLVDGKKNISTTFSNSGCFPTYCLQQSYPKNFPFHHDAGSGAVRVDLPGRCSRQNVVGGTTMYRIERLIDHSDSNLHLEFRDLLKQSNTLDNLCDESWSLDNIHVSIITIK